MEILGKLFGSEGKTKIIRLFLFNPEVSYNALDISRRTNVEGRRIRSILATLLNIGLIRKRSSSKEAKRDKTPVYFLDQKFPYVSILSDLLAAASLKTDERLTKKLMSSGKIKLIIAAGIFVRQNDARLDLLIVGDDIHEGKLDRIIKSIETDIGRDLAYSSLTTSDFRYRLDLHDRLIRDVIDFDYIVLVDKIGFSQNKA
jgi:hypothetical protein